MINTKHQSLLQLAIEDVCSEYVSAETFEEADAVITLKELQEDISRQLNSILNEKQREFITVNFLKSELNSNNLPGTLISTQEGTIEVWLTKKVK
jgi:predicted nucleic acid-binding protein